MNGHLDRPQSVLSRTTIRPSSATKRARNSWFDLPGLIWLDLA
jgi:hypothetical protein